MRGKCRVAVDRGGDVRQAVAGGVGDALGAAGVGECQGAGEAERGRAAGQAIARVFAVDLLGAEEIVQPEEMGHAAGLGTEGYGAGHFVDGDAVGAGGANDDLA